MNTVRLSLYQSDQLRRCVAHHSYYAGAESTQHLVVIE